MLAAAGACSRHETASADDGGFDSASRAGVRGGRGGRMRPAAGGGGQQTMARNVNFDLFTGGEL
jgi:hypothetical protein